MAGSLPNNKDQSLMREFCDPKLLFLIFSCHELQTDFEIVISLIWRKSIFYSLCVESSLDLELSLIRVFLARYKCQEISNVTSVMSVMRLTASTCSNLLKLPLPNYETRSTLRSKSFDTHTRRKWFLNEVRMEAAAD